MLNPYDRTPAGRTWVAGDPEFERAVEAGVGAGTMRRLNDVPTWRIDHMPYGGVKDSGLGQEGPRYTIEEMTELELMEIRRP